MAKGKALLARIPDGALLAGAIILASAFSFGLGLIAGRDTREGNLSIEQLPLTASALPGTAAPRAPESPEAAPASLPAGGQYVASKNGTKYYLPTCGTAKRINDDNKVWFDTKEEAEAAGFTPAANCPGL